MSNKNPVNPVYLSFATDMRKYVGAKDGYYGNCNVDRLLVVPTRSAAAEAAVLDLIRMIKRAKDQLPDTVKKGNHDHLMMQQGLVIGDEGVLELVLVVVEVQAEAAATHGGLGGSSLLSSRSTSLALSGKQRRCAWRWTAARRCVEA
ncbi:hypothetical protein HU200_016486 [Digitaria exilis]|uniref:Uncharacterized protein n=1 Tax=Digitaria exilis TaxID=1010633 RepID=A0A835F8G6_9POAL|nr:hypothetical protein HU200_016486 [Digitaria exilis]